MATPPSRSANTLPGKPVANSLISLNTVVFPRDTNPLKLATAGVVLKLVDVAASMAASRHCGEGVVTASVDCMNFIHHAHLWEVIAADCQVTKAWKSSMEVEVLVNAHNLRTNDHRLIAEGFFVCVAMDDDMKPAPAPPAIPNTPAEKLKAEQAEQRRQSRFAENTLLNNKEETRIALAENPALIKRLMVENDANIHNNVFGGVILELIHMAGEKAANEFAQSPVIAVRQDRMSFEQPAYIGDKIQAMAVVTRSWNTSMEVQVDILATTPSTRRKRYIASSSLVFVAQDEAGHPKPVPTFEPQTEKQIQRWQDADIRRAIRLKTLSQSC